MGYNLSDLFDQYILLEKEILKKTCQISYEFCARCRSACCKEDFCRESIESPFLSELIGRQKISYNSQAGWLGPKGCRLEYGRPPVCYEFFCEKILNSSEFKRSNLPEIIKEFTGFGNRARGKTHLICVDNPGSISDRKINKMLEKIKILKVICMII